MLKDIIGDDYAKLKDKHIEQIISMCGDGQLTDASVCSKDFRKYLDNASPDDLRKHIDRLLGETKIAKGGLALQDAVNEVGHRLGFDIIHGRYQGIKNDIGYDGVWQHQDFQLIVEVKTTDAYRINLDIVDKYRKEYLAKESPGKDAHILIVVGRQDTGDLEAQIRGSQHNWSVRMISIEALVRMMFICLENTSQLFQEQLRKIFIPIEYTRLDHMVDYIVNTQEETNRVVDFALNDDTDETISDDHRAYTADHQHHDSLKENIIHTIGKIRKIRKIRSIKNQTPYILMTNQIHVFAC